MFSHWPISFLYTKRRFLRSYKIEEEDEVDCALKKKQNVFFTNRFSYENKCMMLIKHRNVDASLAVTFSANERSPKQSCHTGQACRASFF